jgi:hypothetical protein
VRSLRFVNAKGIDRTLAPLIANAGVANPANDFEYARER